MQQVVFEHSFTRTRGIWNIIKVNGKIHIPDNFVWVKGLDGLKDRFWVLYPWENEKRVSGYTRGLQEFLLNIEKNFNYEPIKYLYYLYYTEKNKFSVNQIQEYLDNNWIIITESCLYHYMTHFLWWELNRDDRSKAIKGIVQLILIRENEYEK